MIKKIIIAVALGLLAIVFFAHYDVWTHKKIIQMAQGIALRSLHGNFSGTIQSLNFFGPSMVLADVEMSSLEDDLWLWRCKKCEITCSWLQLLFKGVLEQHVIVDGFECSSRINNMRLAIEPHCMAMMQKTLLPFSTELKSIVFKDAHYCVNDSENNITASFFLNSSSLRIGRHFKTAMSIVDGYIDYEKNRYVDKVATDVSLTTGYNGDVLDACFNVAGILSLSHLGDQGGCYLSGQWKSDHGRFSLRNAHNSIKIDPVIVTRNEIRLNAQVPLFYLLQCTKSSLITQNIKGMVTATARMSRDESRHVDGQIVCEDVVVNNCHMCDSAKIVFARYGYDWGIKLGMRRSNQECKGSGYWYEQERKGELTVSNTTDLSATVLPYWRINYNNFLTHMTVENDIFVGTYCVIANNILNKVVHTTSGNFVYDKKDFSLQADLDENQLSFSLQCFPELKMHHCFYKDKDKKDLIVLEHCDDNVSKIKGTILFPFVRSLIDNVFHYDFQGEGTLVVTSEFFADKICANFSLKDSTIRLAQTYNFIDDFNGCCLYDKADRSLIFENINLSLHTGMVNCLRASLLFDSQGKLTFLHAPLVLDRCLLNVKKDLFAIVSGNLLFSKYSNRAALVSGRIIIDKAQLKENLFSSAIQKQLLAYTHGAFSLPNVPVKCDLFIETKSPIRVDTALLQTNAKVAIGIQKEMNDPVVVGSIVLNSGILNFPYKPLFITKGIITFSPDQLFNPSIELLARNKIKKYDVSLQVEGTLSNHQIILDSTPFLSEEQVAGLLLIGSEETSLNSLMPAFIVQNLKNLIFSNNQSTFLDKYFKPLLRTFNINLIPSFTDQTGRGGLRGALEIGINDRWRAVIQKNFSLTEDTKFELEFLLSDDIAFRAIRDERRDIGGEVEMRWKF